MGKAIKIEIPMHGWRGDYDALRNKPKINEVEVEGEKTGEEYNLQNKLVEGAGVKLTDNPDHTTTIEVDGGTSKTFTFTQSVPAEEWNIPHNLHKFPSVTVVDSGGSVVIGEILYIDEDNITVAFQAAFSGKAYLN